MKKNRYLGFYCIDCGWKMVTENPISEEEQARSIRQLVHQHSKHNFWFKAGAYIEDVEGI